MRKESLAPTVKTIFAWVVLTAITPLQFAKKTERKNTTIK
jgi:hypothetical protein